MTFAHIAELAISLHLSLSETHLILELDKVAFFHLPDLTLIANTS